MKQTNGQINANPSPNHTSHYEFLVYTLCKRMAERCYELNTGGLQSYVTSLHFLRSNREWAKEMPVEILLTLGRRNVYKATMVNTSLDPHTLGTQLEVRRCYFKHSTHVHSYLSEVKQNKCLLFHVYEPGNTDCLKPVLAQATCQVYVTNHVLVRLPVCFHFFMDH